MVYLLFSPHWFYHVDSLFELVTVFVALLVAFSSYKFYCINKKKTFLDFSLAFFFIGLSYIMKIIANIFIYSKEIQSHLIGDVVIWQYSFQRLELVQIVGYISYRLFFLISLLFLVTFLNDSHKLRDRLLFLYFIIVVIFFSTYSYFLFHITAVVMLLAIILHYFKNYVAKFQTTSLCVLGSFLLIFLSQLFFIFVLFDSRLYVVGEFLQLFGYLLLLGTYIVVLRK